jgi:DNA segregation ATPase FtsK/SpoIIIE, S-DNA-T family
VGVAGWGVWWQSVRHARRQASARLVRVVADATGGKPEDCRVRVRRWQGWRSPEPTDFSAGWSQLFADSDAKAQAKLLGHIAEKTGATKAGMTLAAEWWPAQDSGRFIRTALQPTPVPTDPAEPSRPDAEVQAESLRAELAAKYKSAGEFRVTVLTADESGMTSFRVSYPPGFDDHSDDARAALQQKVAAKLHGRRRATWLTQENAVVFDRRPPMPDYVPNPCKVGGEDWRVIDLGVDEHGELVTLNLRTTPHTLVVGPTGAGKTVVLRTMATAWAAKGCRVFLGDQKQVEFMGFGDWPGIRVAGETQDIADMIDELHAEMVRRYTLKRTAGVPLDSHDPWVFIGDEYEDLVDTLLDWWQNGGPEDDDEEGLGKRRTWARKATGKGLPPTVRKVKALARMARAANIDLILGTQSVYASWFDGAIKLNFQGRIAAGPLDKTQAHMTFGDSSVGRDVPADAKGRITVRAGQAAPVEVQGWWTPNPEEPGSGPLSESEDRRILAELRRLAEAAQRAAAVRRESTRPAVKDDQTDPDPVPPAELVDGDVVSDPMGEDPEQTFTVTGVVEQGDVWDVTLRDADGVEVTWGRGADEVFLRAA